MQDVYFWRLGGQEGWNTRGPPTVTTSMNSAGRLPTLPRTRIPQSSPPPPPCWISILGIRRTRAPWSGWNGSWEKKTTLIFFPPFCQAQLQIGQSQPNLATELVAPSPSLPLCGQTRVASAARFLKQVAEWTERRTTSSISRLAFNCPAKAPIKENGCGA